jgi:sigma-E factor negative regulatory protein RseA
LEKISVLMDGEMGRREGKAQIQRLEHDPELSQGWDTYHLIGDVLRQEASLGVNVQRRLHDRLEREPIVIAPHALPAQRVLRHSLPLAAGIGGIALVAWLAVSLHPFTPQQAPARLAGAPALAASDLDLASGRGLPASVQGAADEYLRAHQEFSPTTAMQGVASYARTVSLEQGDASQ